MKTVFDQEDLSYKLDYSEHIIPQEQVTRQVADAIVRDKETKIVKALIDLGWTPPSEQT